MRTGKNSAVRIFIWVLAAVSALVVARFIIANVYLSMPRGATTLERVATISIPVPFKFGRPFIDYMALNGDRLYAGYSRHGIVGVVDTSTNRTIASVSGLARVHGVAIVPDRGLGFASSSGDNVVGVFDLRTNSLVQKIPAGDGTDAIIYDRKLNLVYAGDHTGKVGTMIDAATLKVVATISLGGEPEYPQADPDSGVIYQNLEDTSELVVIDPRKQEVTHRYKLAPGKEPTGLALDAANHRLFAACGNGQLIVLNAEDGQIVAAVPIGSLVYGVGYDPGLHRIYVPSVLGRLTVIQQDSADNYHVLEDGFSPLGGHSVAVDPATHRVYVANFGSITAYDVVAAH